MLNTENDELQNSGELPDEPTDALAEPCNVKPPSMHKLSQDRFWQLLISSTKDDPIHLPGTPDYQNRAVSLIRGHVAECCTKFTAAHQELISLGSAFPYYQNQLVEESEQFERLRHQLASASWTLAESWLSNSRDEAIETLVRVDGGVFSYAAYLYLTSVIGRQHRDIKKTPLRFGKTMRTTKLDTDGWWLPFVTTAGGSGHFLCYSLSFLIADTVCKLLTLVTEGSYRQSLTIFDSVLLRRLTQFEGLWKEPFKNQIELACNLPTDKLPLYGRDIVRRRMLLRILSAEGGTRLRYADNTLAVAQKEISGLRKILERSEAQVAELKSQLSTTEVSLTKAKDQLSTKEVNINLADDHIELRGDYRLLQKKCEKAEVQAASAASELASLRLFVTSLLAAPPDTEITTIHQPRSVTTHRSTWKVVVVGGHERFHSKLRRELPRSVFLHPDRSDFTADTFEHADCVVFCVGYCSHKLAWKAAQQVRRLGLPSGYTNYVNVDKVLEDIREILHPVGTRPA